MKFLAAIAAALVLSQAVAAQNGTWSAPWVAGSISTTPAPSATRTAFSVTPYPATTPAAYVTGFVVYGAGKWVTFVPTNNCSVSGTAQVGNPTCAPQVVSSGNYTVTSVEAINATHVIAVAGPGLWLFNGNTLVGSWNVTGGVLDFFTNWYYTTSSQQPDHASLLMLNNMLYIGTSNWTAGGKGAIIKFNLWTWSAEWWSWTTQAYANYPLSWGVINSTDVIAFRSSATSGTSTTDIGVVTAATGAMWPVQSFSASYYIRGYAPQIVNELVVLVGYNFYTVTITPTGASYQTNSVDTVQYASNIVPLTNGGLVVTSDTSAYVFNVSTGTSVRVASYSGSYYIHQVLIANGTSAVLFGTSWGIYAWNLNNQATWKWFALPSSSGSGSQWSYGCEALSWGSAPGVILASFNQYVSGTGGVFALNATSGQQLWRFSDNFDVVGAAVAVPAPNYAGVWSYYGALRNTGPYGTRSAVGWATNGTGWTNIPSSTPTAPTQDGSSYYTTIYCPMTDLVISATPNYFWASNSDGSTNFSTYISIGSAYPYSGIATFPTMACVGGSSYLYCYKFGATTVTSVSVSFTIQYIQASGTTLYVYGGSNVYTVDTTATSLSTTQVTKSTDALGYPLAGFQTTIATVKVAVVPYSSSVDVVADNKAVSAIGGFGSSTNSFYSNAALVDGSAWIGGYGTVLGTAGYFLARVALPTPALTRYTTPKLGKIVYVTGAGSNAIIALGDNLTAWSTEGTLYWAVNAPAGTQFYQPYGTSLINMQGVPTVDTVRGVIILWLTNASSTSSRIGVGIFNLYTGALLQIFGITGTTSYPKGTPMWWQGTWLIGSKTHACAFAITNDVDYTNTNTARWCTTIDGYNQIGGFGVKGNWVFLGQSGETIAFTAPNITSLQNWNFVQTGSFAAPSLLAELKANLALIVGVVAVIVVILIVVGIIVKVKSGAAARAAANKEPEYQRT